MSRTDQAKSSLAYRMSSIARNHEVRRFFSQRQAFQRSGQLSEISSRVEIGRSRSGFLFPDAARTGGGEERILNS